MPRVGADFCITDTSYRKLAPTPEAQQVFLTRICVDSSGHYMHALVSSPQYDWIATLHMQEDIRKTAGQLTEQADTVWYKSTLTNPEGLCLGLEQQGFQRVVYLLSQEKVAHLLQLDAFFNTREDAMTYLGNHPQPTFLQLCD